MSQSKMSAIIACVVSLVIAIGGWSVTYLSQSRQADVKRIEIAVGILRAKPEDSIRPAREWAVNVISYYSHDVPLSDAARNALLEHQVLGLVGIAESAGEALPAINNR